MSDDSVEEIHIFLDPEGEEFYDPEEVVDSDEELRVSVATPDQMNIIHGAIMLAMKHIQDDE